jgi:uncharacterized membrane protein
MKSTVGVYESHEKALEAVKILQDAGFPAKQLSVIGQAEIVEDHMRIKSRDAASNVGVSVGAVAGPVVGILTGAGVFAVPGFGFLFGAGAVLGALVGFDFGIISGGIVSLLTTLFTNKDKVVKYHEHLKEGKFLVIANGSDEEVKKAQGVLENFGSHIELNTHVSEE